MKVAPMMTGEMLAAIAAKHSGGSFRVHEVSQPAAPQQGPEKSAAPAKDNNVPGLVEISKAVLGTRLDVKA